jgi:phosphatidate cytidylyltransferase
VLRDRLLTAAVGLPLLIGLVCCAPVWLFSLTVLVLTGIGLHEYFTLVDLRTRFSPVVELAWGGAVAFSMLATDTALTAAVLVFGLFVLFLLRLPDIQPAQSLQNISLSLFGVVYIGFLLPHLLWIRWGPEGEAWVFFLLLVAMGGDTAAYAVGRRWGRRKLIPHISPGKTVAGSVGAIGGHLCAGGVAWWWLFPQRGVGEMLCVALVAGFLAQVGDLCESAIKRAYGAKDSGWLFPGHGGVLDRVDSLLFAGPFLYYYVVLWP